LTRDIICDIIDLSSEGDDKMAEIERLIALNGYQANMDFEVGKLWSKYTVRKIHKDKGDGKRYIVFLSDNRELDVISDNVIVQWKY
jgi:hypothetical protein